MAMQEKRGWHYRAAREFAGKGPLVLPTNEKITSVSNHRSGYEFTFGEHKQGPGVVARVRYPYADEDRTRGTATLDRFGRISVEGMRPEELKKLLPAIAKAAKTVFRRAPK